MDSPEKEPGTESLTHTLFALVEKMKSYQTASSWMLLHRTGEGKALRQEWGCLEPWGEGADGFLASGRSLAGPPRSERQYGVPLLPAKAVIPSDTKPAGSPPENAANTTPCLVCGSKGRGIYPSHKWPSEPGVPH